MVWNGLKEVLLPFVPQLPLGKTGFVGYCSNTTPCKTCLIRGKSEMNILAHTPWFLFQTTFHPVKKNYWRSLGSSPVPVVQSRLLWVAVSSPFQKQRQVPWQWNFHTWKFSALWSRDSDSGPSLDSGPGLSLLTWETQVSEPLLSESLPPSWVTTQGPDLAPPLQIKGPMSGLRNTWRF